MFVYVKITTIIKSFSNFYFSNYNPFFISDTLEWLKLGGNQLTKVPQHAFRNLSRLRQLDLRSNKLTKVEIDSFAEYGKTLKFIFLQKNRYTFVIFSVFYV